MNPRLLTGLFLAAGVLLLGLVSPPAHGQLIQGSLTGNVTDPSGAAIPDAVVSVLNTQTGQGQEELKQHAIDNLMTALEATNWKISGPGGAAGLLGIKPTTLASRMKALHLTRSTREPCPAPRIPPRKNPPVV